jgi:DNA-binding transcriptional regulator YhcF (GntR family)
MTLKLNISRSNSVPLYRRIADAVCDAVAAGRVEPGAKLPAHMGLARQLGVSPLTVSRSYEYLKSRGIVRQRRGSGTYLEADAPQRLTRGPRRQIERLAIVLGEKSPAQCLRETLFIITDMLDGVRQVLGSRHGHVTYHEALTRDSLGPVGPHDAVLVMSPREVDPVLVAELLAGDIPVVAMGGDPTSIKAPRVNYDRYDATVLACRHLVDCGFRRIGYIGMRVYTAPVYQRDPYSPKFLAFTNVLHNAGLDVCARYVRQATVQPGKAYAAVREIIAAGDLPEAFFVDTDYKAMEVICALNDAGLRVPQDIAVAAYDDVPESARFSPALTTVRVPRSEIGRRAAQMIIDWPGHDAQPDSIVLPSQLVIRESCGSRPMATVAPAAALSSA